MKSRFLRGALLGASLCVATATASAQASWDFTVLQRPSRLQDAPRFPVLGHDFQRPAVALDGPIELPPSLEGAPEVVPGPGLPGGKGDDGPEAPRRW